MRLRRASVIVALFLLTSPATANAECAWVVWGEVLTAGKIWGSTTEYVLVSAPPTQSDWLGGYTQRR
jgi:hypothetical protein